MLRNGLIQWKMNQEVPNITVNISVQYHYHY